MPLEEYRKCLKERKNAFLWAERIWADFMGSDGSRMQWVKEVIEDLKPNHVVF